MPHAVFDAMAMSWSVTKLWFVGAFLIRDPISDNQLLQNRIQSIGISFMPMDTPASSACSERTRPTRWPAWPMPAPNAKMFLPNRAMLSLKKPSGGLWNSMPWRKRRLQNRSSMIWKLGDMRNCPKFWASHSLHKLSATPLAGCQRRGDYFTIVTLNWTITRPNAPSNLWPSVGKLDVRGFRGRR